VSIPSILLCVLVAGYFGLRIFVSGHHVAEAVRERIAHSLNCTVRLSGANLSPMGTMILKDLDLSYRKADGLHQVFRADSVEIEFEPLSLLDSHLRLTAVKFTGAALAVERDSEGWLTLGRIVRSMDKRPALTLTVEARDSVVRVGDYAVPVDFFGAEVSRTGDRIDVYVTEGLLLGGGLEGNGYITLEEDPRIHAEMKFRGISLPRLYGENKEPAFDVQGEASCEIFADGRASSRSLLGANSRLAIKNFSVALTESEKGKGPSPIVSVGGLDLRPASAPITSNVMNLTLALERPKVSIQGLLACRHHVGLIPAGERVNQMMARLDQVAVAFSGDGLEIQYPRLSATTEKFAGRLSKDKGNVSLEGFKAHVWGGDVEASARCHRSETSWLADGRVDVKNLGLQNAGPLVLDQEGQAPGAPVPSLAFKPGGWLTGDFSFSARSQAEQVFTGTGNAAIQRAQLWGLPAFACVAALLKIPSDATSAPQDFRAAFAADGDKVSFSRVDLTNDRVKVLGKGSVRYSGDVDVDFDLNVTPPKSSSGEGLLKIFGAGQKHRVSVNGDFASPEAAMGEKR
jgi:hypothetical protein